jgi:hypothetical protein
MKMESADKGFLSSALAKLGYHSKSSVKNNAQSKTVVSTITGQKLF